MTAGDDRPGRRGMDRRDVLRRSAILGGGLVWTVPTVQAIMPSAFAQEGSFPQEELCLLYAVKIDFDPETGAITEVNDGPEFIAAAFDCLSPGELEQVHQGGSLFITSAIVNPGATEEETTMVVELDSQARDIRGWSKAGQGCTEVVPDLVNPRAIVTFAKGSDGRALSNGQLLFCVPQGAEPEAPATWPPTAVVTSGQLDDGEGGGEFGNAPAGGAGHYSRPGG